MIKSFFNAGGLFPALVMFFILCSPLSAQVPGEEDDFPDEDLLLMEGEGLTIAASPETTQQMDVVSREEIEQAHAPDLAVLLQETLGLGFTRYGPYGNQADINLRGFDSSRIALLVNGVPVNSAMDGGFDFNTIDLNSIDHIEVIHGGSDTKFNVSGALGGVINIVTAGKPKPGLKIGASLSNTASLPGHYYDRDGTKAGPEWEDLADAQKAEFSLGWGAEKFSWTAGLFANRAANHFIFKEPIFNLVRRKDNNEVYDGGANASFTKNFDNLSRLIVSGNLYYGDKNIPTSGFSRLAGKQTDLAAGESVLFDMPRAFRDELAMEVSLGHNWHQLSYAPPLGAESLHNQNTLNFINRWNWYPNNYFVFRLGGDYRYAWIDSTDLGLRDRHDGGLYLTAEYQIIESLLLISSVKGIFAPDTAVPVPKLGLLWTPIEDLSIKNNYFRSFKLPNFEDLYWSPQRQVGGNPDLKPEDGWGADLQAAYRFGKSVNIESTFFVQWTKDSIHWAIDSGGTWHPSNVGEAAYFGFDTKLGLNFPGFAFLDKIKLSLSYQYLLSYLLSYGYTWSSGKRIPYMPVHTAGAALDLPWNSANTAASGSLILQGRWESVRYTNTSNITKLMYPFIFDLTLNQKTGEYFTVFVVGRNLLNKPYESFSGYFMPGMTVTLGLRMDIQ
ncbi:TonB-dependent receptor plug domain-containing protein [Leadbettera azotonutricia]|uniref:Putative TonB-dependent receptor n=1 Tax=Leadbettera azotonutricia (strain ATCC BAA-888 / DSM 13862 / ZAS-9) TaxID=545695 RepID=F5Y850_LEAAZ|nr:TonB-dependent receptor [Leadbettera azotonutricia]AEF80502.1 putative TonB-dependent receptor [Leadbettera azotonutricia ZAS-9]